MKSDRKKKEAERRRERIKRAKRIYVENLCSISHCLLIAEADRVLCHLVMLLPVFLHWIYKMKYSSYQYSFAILSWVVYSVVVEKFATRQKEIGNHRFQK